MPPLALHLDRGGKRGRHVGGRLARRAGSVFVRRRERRCRRATARAEPKVPPQLFAMERTPGGGIPARGQGQGRRATSGEADGRRREVVDSEAHSRPVWNKFECRVREQNWR